MAKRSGYHINALRRAQAEAIEFVQKKKDDPQITQRDTDSIASENLRESAKSADVTAM